MNKALSLVTLVLAVYSLSCERKQVVELKTKPASVRPALPHECPNGGVVVESVPVCDGRNGSDGISVGATVASSTVCSSGGKHITMFRDLDSNGVKGLSEPVIDDFHICNGIDAALSITTASASQCPSGGIVINGSPVCNGLNGANGTNGVDGASIGVQVNNATCSHPTRPGKTIEFYRDTNNNGTKDSSESIVSTTLLCDGANGLDGTSPSIVALSPGDPNCPNGGVKINSYYVCNGLNGTNGTNGADGASIGVNITNTTCSSPTRPGKSVEFYKDANNNGIKDPSETAVSTMLVCDGENGASPTVVALSPGDPDCPNGGVKINGNPVCNGLNGIDGASFGSNVIAAKLCPSDTDPMAEYGIFIGTELYAVLYSPPHAGLVRLPPGTYTTTTTSSAKTFTYAKTGTTATLTCGSSSVTYDLTTGTSSSGSGPYTLTGVTCLVKLQHNYGSEKHYKTTVTGAGVAGDYYIEYLLNNSSYHSTSGCFSSYGVWTDNNCLSSQYQWLPLNTVRFTPISSSMNYTLYIRGNSSLQIQSAVLTKISTNQKLNCTVDNTAP